MSNKTKKVTTALMMITSLILNSKKVFADTYNLGDPTKIGDAVEKLKPALTPAFNLVMQIAVYVSILIVGLNVIIYRGKSEERTDAMTGLLYIAIGVLIFSSAYFIYDFLISIIE